MEVDKIREFLYDKLPDYMQPQYFVPLEKIPLTISGKVDRKNLPKVEGTINAKKIVPPRNNIEIKLHRIWKELLKVDNFSVFDRFGSLGGHSLLAVRMILQINKAFNIHLSFSEIKSNLTISSLSEHISSGFYSKNSAVLTIQKSKKNRTLFMFHPISGLAYDYVNLSNYIKNWTIYGINNPHFGEEDYNYASLQEMASQYLSIMHDISPEGPYVLAGWSFGGLIALEGAIQLAKRGKKVESVILIDTYNPECLKTQPSNEDIKSILKQDNILYDSIEGQCFFNEIKKNNSLMRAYTPSNYKGDVTLIKAYSTDKLPNAGWDKDILPNLNTTQLTATHYELFKYPSIKFLASKLLEVLHEI